MGGIAEKLSIWSFIPDPQIGFDLGVGRQEGACVARLISVGGYSTCSPDHEPWRDAVSEFASDRAVMAGRDVVCYSCNNSKASCRSVIGIGE